MKTLFVLIAAAIGALAVVNNTPTETYRPPTILEQWNKSKLDYVRERCEAEGVRWTMMKSCIEYKLRQ